MASFFVSRVDTEADKRLEASGGPEELKGTLAIANAKLAYQAYKEIFSGAEWDELAAAGATPQRCLWASTSTKNPEYRDVHLRRGADRARDGRHDAARDDRGVPGPRARRRHARARRGRRASGRSRRFAAAGIDYDDVVETLEREGVQKFADSFKELFSRHRVQARLAGGRVMGERSEFRRELGQQLRVDSVRTSAAAGSGHPTSSMSAADLMAVLLDGHLRLDYANPGEPGQRPPDLLQGPRLAAVLRDPQGGAARSTTRSC